MSNYVDFENMKAILQGIAPKIGGGGGGTATGFTEWQAETEYTAEQIVVYQGQIYKVKEDFTSGTEFSTEHLEEYVPMSLTQEQIDELSSIKSTTIPVGKIQKNLLYNGTTPQSQGTTQTYTLSDAYSNYDYLEIYYTTEGGIVQEIEIIPLGNDFISKGFFFGYVYENRKVSGSIKAGSTSNTVNITLTEVVYDSITTAVFTKIYGIKNVVEQINKINIDIPTSEIARLAMPSEIYENITLTNLDWTANSYTAPANGYICLKSGGATLSPKLGIYSNTVEGKRVFGGEGSGILMPSFKDEQFDIYVDTYVPQFARFFYSIGDAMELGLIDSHTRMDYINQYKLGIDQLYTQTSYNSASKSIQLTDIKTYDYLYVTITFSEDGAIPLYSNTYTINTSEVGEHMLTLNIDNSNFNILSATIVNNRLDFTNYQVANLAYYRIDSICGVNTKVDKKNTAIEVDPATVALLHFDEGYKDECIDSAWSTGGSPSINTTVKKFGEGSVRLPSDSYIRSTNNDRFNFKNNDFTIECWVNVLSLEGNQTVFASLNDFKLGVFLGGNHLLWFLSHGGASWDMIAGDAGSHNGEGTLPVTTGWHHIAMVKNGDKFYGFLDGQIDKYLTGISSVVDRNESLCIGRWGNGGYFLNGYVDELRVSSMARYTSSFTPPTKPFTR